MFLSFMFLEKLDCRKDGRTGLAAVGPPGAHLFQMGLVDVKDEVVGAVTNVLAEVAADLLLKVVLLLVSLEVTSTHPRKAQ
jgi:hypothetical protein